MPTHDLNISLLLECSKQQDELIAGHQREMQQVLANKEDLRTAIVQLLQENATLKTQLAAEKAKNTQLQTEIEQLRNRPIHTDTYIENEYINQQHNYPLPRASRTKRKQLNNTNFTQLQLWNNPTVSST